MPEKELKCPICKGKEFEEIDISPMHEPTYCEGNYIFIHRCKNCKVVVATDEKLEK